MIELEKPHGVRATRTGGHWEVVRGPSPRSINYFTVEYDKLLGLCSRANAFALREDIATLMKKAENGRCTFGRGKTFDVDRMSCTETILELRFMSVPKISGQGPLHLRLYFTEPKHIPGTLYAAKLAWKHGGTYGKQEQNRHALEAERRVREFFR